MSKKNLFLKTCLYAKIDLTLSKIKKMKQSFSSETLERFKEYRNQGFGKNAMYKLFSKDALLELLYHYLEKEENLTLKDKQNRILSIEKAEIIYED